jgi:hypothetical protein
MPHPCQHSENRRIHIETTKMLTLKQASAWNFGGNHIFFFSLVSGIESEKSNRTKMLTLKSESEEFRRESQIIFFFHRNDENSDTETSLGMEFWRESHFFFSLVSGIESEKSNRTKIMLTLKQASAGISEGIANVFFFNNLPPPSRSLLVIGRCESAGAKKKQLARGL